jgi:acetolactate synthase-1/2/3 large subunit
MHITGQVNDAESRAALGVKARQVGFQETDIVSMVSSITKYAVKVSSIEELATELRIAMEAATTHRMGPVLLDVPMNVQKQSVSVETWERALSPIPTSLSGPSINWGEIDDFYLQAERPLVIIGGGAFLGGVTSNIQEWCEDHELPYVSSWSSLPHLNRAAPMYLGSQGVYGNRLANWAVQSADRILALGTRLDNRQRTGNPAAYAPFAKLLIVDIDPEELGKYRLAKNYRCQRADLSTWTAQSDGLKSSSQNWTAWLNTLKVQTIDSGTSVSVKLGELNPYEAVSAVQKRLPRKSIVTADVGANLCWVYQSYGPDDSFLFTAAGNSPMGYSLPAAIGAKLVRPDSPVWCFIGDGGLQMNLQELQTVVNYELDIVVVVLNNFGYGIIKQFQDAYFDGRHEATGRGYSLPNFEKIASAYGISYQRVNSIEEINALNIPNGTLIIDVILPEGALITPKIEMDRFLHDQFPYTNSSRDFHLPYPYPDHPSQLSGTAGPTV